MSRKINIYADGQNPRLSKVVDSATGELITNVTEVNLTITQHEIKCELHVLGQGVQFHGTNIEAEIGEKFPKNHKATDCKDTADEFERLRERNAKLEKQVALHKNRCTIG